MHFKFCLLYLTETFLYYFVGVMVLLIFEIAVAGHVNGDTSLCVGVYPTLVCAVTLWQCFGG